MSIHVPFRSRLVRREQDGHQGTESLQDHDGKECDAAMQAPPSSLNCRSVTFINDRDQLSSLKVRGEFL